MVTIALLLCWQVLYTPCGTHSIVWHLHWYLMPSFATGFVPMQRVTVVVVIDVGFDVAIEGGGSRRIRRDLIKILVSSSGFFDMTSACHAASCVIVAIDVTNVCHAASLLGVAFDVTSVCHAAFRTFYITIDVTSACHAAPWAVGQTSVDVTALVEVAVVVTLDHWTSACGLRIMHFATFVT